ADRQSSRAQGPVPDQLTGDLAEVAPPHGLRVVLEPARPGGADPVMALSPGQHLPIGGDRDPLGAGGPDVDPEVDGGAGHNSGPPSRRGPHGGTRIPSWWAARALAARAWSAAAASLAYATWMWLDRCRAMNWSRDTPCSTACMIGHSRVVSAQRRSVSSAGRLTALARPMSRCSSPSATKTRDHTSSPGRDTPRTVPHPSWTSSEGCRIESVPA